MSSKLFERAKIGNLKLKNRIIMPAMSTSFSTENGAVTDRLIDYYVERAKGGAGLIIVEAACIDSPVGKLRPIQLCIDSDKYIAGLSDLTEAIHQHDIKVALQLHHAGRQTSLAYTEGNQPVSASNVYCPMTRSNSRSLTHDEAEALIEKFAEASQRAKIAGFDAVEFHGAHGYLIAQFLSPYTNKRDDSYGGNLEGRMRFALQIVERTRKKVGDEFPLIFRLSGQEYVEGGITLDEAEKLSYNLERIGIDALHVSAGIYEARWWSSQPMAIPLACLVPLAEKIKKRVNIPVITVGRINDVDLAEKILLEGEADFVAMGRALIADPYLPRKAAEGKTDEIRKCIACNVCCDNRVSQGLRMVCSVNASVGKEERTHGEIVLTDFPKKVLVIGGGPAGMEAARMLKLRGHNPILYEKNEELGGQLLLSSIPPFKDDINSLISYLKNQISRLHVKVHLKEEADIETVQKENPDTIVVATGAVPFIPNIPGSDEEKVCTAWEVLRGKDTGEKVIVAGGGSVGCETAEFLVEQDKNVTIVEMTSELLSDMENRPRTLLLQRLSNNGVKILLNTKIEKISRDGVHTIDKKWRLGFIESDSVVLALGCKTNRKFVEEIKEKREIYLIGDCRKPGKIIDAIHQGFEVSFKI